MKAEPVTRMTRRRSSQGRQPGSKVGGSPLPPAPPAYDRRLLGYDGKSPRSPTEGRSVMSPEEQNRLGLQRALRGLGEGLALQSADSPYTECLTQLQTGFCETLELDERLASQARSESLSPDAERRTAA